MTVYRAPMRGGTRSSAHGRPGSLWSWVVTGGAVAVLAAASLWVTRSAIFDARRISVTGNRHLSDREVLETADVNGTTNVLWFSPGRAESRLERDPWIRSAQVTRSLPSTVSITIHERVPAAVIVAGERRSVIASDGTVLGPSGEPEALPEIESSSSTQPGSSALETGQIMTALRALQAVPGGLRAQIRRASFGPDGGLVLELRGGVRALYGDGTQLTEKGQAFAAILGWARRHGVVLASVDVRAPVTPAARPVVAASPTPPVPLGPASSPGTAGRSSPESRPATASPSPSP